jgi:chromosome segregation ATPase
VNPSEWHQFLTGILREGPGTVAAAVIAFFAGVVVCRWWLHGDFKKKVVELKLRIEHLSENYHEALRKQALALQELGIAREQLNASQKEARQHADEAARLTQVVAGLRKAIRDDEASVTRTRLEAENKELAQGKQTLEKTVEKLQTELAQVRGELAHSAKWLKRFDEEIARLTQDESVGAQ